MHGRWCTSKNIRVSINIIVLVIVIVLVLVLVPVRSDCRYPILDVLVVGRRYNIFHH